MTNLRDSHAHVLAISKFCTYEYKQALFCMIAGAVLHIALSNGCSCIVRCIVEVRFICVRFNLFLCRFDSIFVPFDSVFGPFDLFLRGSIHFLLF